MVVVFEIVAGHFNVKPVVCINKYDINSGNSNKIIDFCRDAGIEVAGKIPFNPVVTGAMVAGKSFVEFSDDEVSDEIKSMWGKIKTLICNDIKCRTEKDAGGEDQGA
jgi:MinD superfamily P-loop ATPase